jgi:opacity protein-like surface antigen
MKAAIAVLGIAAASFGLPAAAQSTDTGFYVGANVGQSKLKDVCSGCDDKDTAWRFLGGYQINRNFSAELGYTNLGEFSGTKVNAWELVGVGLFPINNQFGIYGKLGGHHSEAKDGGSETGNGLTYGAGLQFDLSRNLGLRGEWQRYDKLAGISDLKGDVLSVGAIWRFR